MSRPVTGRAVLFGLLGAFGLVSAVNGVMIWFALDSWPGLTSENSYQEGLGYNEVLRAEAIQEELGWLVTASANDSAIEIVISDDGLRPVTGLEVFGVARRPTYEGADQLIRFDELAPGLYRSTVALELPGNWDVIAEVRRESELFQFKRRIYVAP
jgi:nitrogen fixation protein FixH